MPSAAASPASQPLNAALSLLPSPAHHPPTPQLRAFAVSPEGGYRQELHQSPVAFRESDVAPDQEESLRRKDAIILLRNAQLSALWDELHTRQPWRNAAGAGHPLPPFGGEEEASAAGNATRLVAVIAINTGLGARARRDILRRTWVPRGGGLAAMAAEHGLLVRFVVGHSEQRDDLLERAVEAEAAEFGDILRLDMVDTYAGEAWAGGRADGSRGGWMPAPGRRLVPRPHAPGGLLDGGSATEAAAGGKVAGAGVPSHSHPRTATHAAAAALPHPCCRPVCEDAAPVRRPQRRARRRLLLQGG